MLRRIACLMIVLTLIAACGEREPAAERATEGQTSAAAKTLTLVHDTEPQNLLSYIDGAQGSRGGIETQLAIHQRLATFDNTGRAHPMLATELPSQSAGTWVVRPDGTMQTTYRLHHGVTWHDGAPLTARDFVFAWEMVRNPDIPLARREIANSIERIDTPDDHTLVMEWTGLHPYGNAIVEEDVGPLPAHLMESTYRTDKERFLRLPYWNYEAVGVGPYRLAGWEPGSHLTLQAYDQFYRGRAKIDTIVVRFIDDPATVVAHYLAGTIDGQLGSASGLDGAILVSQEWARAGRRPLMVVDLTHWRFMHAQFRDPQPREVLDVRVRRALLHALDRKAMVEALVHGRSTVADSFIAPDDPKWEWVKDVVTRYEYDSARAQRMLADVGWRRTGSGPLVNAAGERVSLAIWGTSGQDGERELSLIADNWRALGVNVEQPLVPASARRDRQFAASFPSFVASTNPLREHLVFSKAYGPACPSEASRWVGTNTGCYQNPEMDRITEQLNLTIDQGGRQQLYRDLMRIQTGDLPLLPLYFNVTVHLFREGVTGMKGMTKPPTSAMWNVAEWDIR